LPAAVGSFERYQREEAWTWEHMALLRARPVYGSDAAKAEVQRIIDELLAIPRDRAKLAADAAEMRSKIAAHKPANGALDIKGGPGGLVDLEFAMQVTQLVSGQCHDPNISAALACMKAAGLVPPEVIEAHGLLARMLVMLRLTAPEGEPATAAARQLVASQCGEPGWPQLLAAHDAARQEIANWWASIRPEQENEK